LPSQAKVTDPVQSSAVTLPMVEFATRALSQPGCVIRDRRYPIKITRRT
jgi:hypothetical protein